MKTVAEKGVERSKRLEVIAQVLGRDKEVVADILVALLENMAADIELMQHLLKLQKGAK